VPWNARDQPRIVLEQQNVGHRTTIPHTGGVWGAFWMAMTRAQGADPELTGFATNYFGGEKTICLYQRLCADTGKPGLAFHTTALEKAEAGRRDTLGKRIANLLARRPRRPT